jgi:anti-sigma-K factor RskA
MTDPNEMPPFEDFAALDALGLLDESTRQRLLAAARRDPKIAALARDFGETAALLALAAPDAEPPPELRAKLLREIAAKPLRAKIISFPQLIPYAIAACLMGLAIAQTLQYRDLHKKYVAESAEADRLRASNAFLGVQVANLEMGDKAKGDASFAGAKVLVAWDPNMNQGVISMHGMPPAPAGYSYQLWVLDPHSPAPMDAGVVTTSGPFSVHHVSMPSPGFAISLEPAGGRPEPTGPLLFAIAPGA